LPVGAPVKKERCLVCDRIAAFWEGERKKYKKGKLKTGQKRRTKGQRAIYAAECWGYVGGPPNPRGGRPRKLPKLGSQSEVISSQIAAFWDRDGYPVSRDLMARRWGIRQATMKQATAVVTRDPQLAGRVKRGTLTLEQAYDQVCPG
jgi:hypothetical protein